MSYFKNIDELVILLKKNNEKLYPIFNSDLKKIEQLVPKSLPAVYKEFLLKMGNGAGSFMKGSSVFYDEIFELNKWGNELLEENSFKKMPKDSFVFWMHQGYQLSFFLLDQSNNPEVYSYSEVEDLDDFKHVGTLIDFFEKQLILSYPQLSEE